MEKAIARIRYLALPFQESPWEASGRMSPTDSQPLSANNAWRWKNSEWIIMDPDMATAEGLVNGTNTRTAPVYMLNASLRVQF